MSQITTHVLDTARGCPAAGIEITLEEETGQVLAQATTNDDGRVGSFNCAALESGTYVLRFATARYLAQHLAEASALQSAPAFYPQVSICFNVTAGEHYHVPLLLSPFGYSTYRGS